MKKVKCPKCPNDGKHPNSDFYLVGTRRRDDGYFIALCLCREARQAVEDARAFVAANPNTAVAQFPDMYEFVVLPFSSLSLGDALVYSVKPKGV